MKKERAVAILEGRVEHTENAVMYELKSSNPDNEWLHDLEEELEAFRMAVEALRR